MSFCKKVYGVEGDFILSVRMRAGLTVQLFSSLTLSVRSRPEAGRMFCNAYSVERGQSFDVPFQNPENLTGRRDV